jgi:hypothetical protein
VSCHSSALLLKNVESRRRTVRVYRRAGRVFFPESHRETRRRTGFSGGAVANERGMPDFYRMALQRIAEKRDMADYSVADSKNWLILAATADPYSVRMAKGARRLQIVYSITSKRAMTMVRPSINRRQGAVARARRERFRVRPQRCETPRTPTMCNWIRDGARCGCGQTLFRQPRSRIRLVG